MLLPVHVAAGGLAMVFGFTALFAKKGGTIHRRAGLSFVCSMLVMAATAAILGVRAGQTGNVFAALMTMYFVITAFATVRPESPWSRRLIAAAVPVALAVALADIAGGVEAFNSPRGALKGVPFQMFFFLASILILAAICDMKILRVGMPRGGARLARHLWRMCFALFIAAGSFFSIRERVEAILPEPLTTGAMRALPIALILVSTIYWLWRVRSQRVVPASR
ncbi:MAG: DUF2306 domain-containing protein [Bryobacteraceae bacterium]|nr:DUF2306 domain-containing protein [Bryobacteraceae bacterium]